MYLQFFVKISCNGCNTRKKNNDAIIRKKVTMRLQIYESRVDIFLSKKFFVDFVCIGVAHLKLLKISKSQVDDEIFGM